MSSSSIYLPNYSLKVGTPFYLGILIKGVPYYLSAETPLVSTSTTSNIIATTDGKRAQVWTAITRNADVDAFPATNNQVVNHNDGGSKGYLDQLITPWSEVSIVVNNAPGDYIGYNLALLFPYASDPSRDLHLAQAQIKQSISDYAHNNRSTLLANKEKSFAGSYYLDTDIPPSTDGKRETTRTSCLVPGQLFSINFADSNVLSWRNSTVLSARLQYGDLNLLPNQKDDYSLNFSFNFEIPKSSLDPFPTITPKNFTDAQFFYLPVSLEDCLVCDQRTGEVVGGTYFPSLDNWQLTNSVNENGVSNLLTVYRDQTTAPIIPINSLHHSFSPETAPLLCKLYAGVYEKSYYCDNGKCRSGIAPSGQTTYSSSTCSGKCGATNFLQTYRNYIIIGSVILIVIFVIVAVAIIALKK